MFFVNFPLGNINKGRRKFVFSTELKPSVFCTSVLETFYGPGNVL